jgi:hypothetical protein
MGKICIPKNASEQDRHEELIKRSLEFDRNTAVQQFRLDAGQFDKLYKQTTGEFYNGNNTPSVEHLKLLKRNVDDFLNHLNKGDYSKAQKLFYLPKEYTKKYPASEKWYNAVENANAFYKGNQQGFTAMLRDVHGFLGREAGSSSIANFLGISSKVRAEKEIIKREQEYTKLINEGNHDLALSYRREHIEPFIKSGEGQVFKDFYDLVTNDKIWDTKQDSYSGNIVEAATIWRKQMLPKLNNLLKTGVDNYLWGFRKAKGTFGDFKNFNEIEAKILKVKEYVDKIGADGASFPVKNLDIVPTLGKANELLQKADMESMREAGNLLDNLIENVIVRDVNINQALMRRKGSGEGEVSYNVLGIMDAYTKAVSRFNYVSKNTNAYLEGLAGFHKMAEKTTDADLSKGIDGMVEYMADSYANMTGQNADANTSKIARGLTAWQAISKLGFPNLRSPARNATQFLQNVVYFGIKGMKETNRLMNNDRMLQRVNDGLADNGILFPEITEIYQNYAPKRIKDESTGLYYEDINPGAGEIFFQRLESVAKTLNKPMTWVENKINRRSTFKIGYTKKWQADSQDMAYLSRTFERRVLRNPKKYLGKEYKGEDIIKDLKELEAPLFGEKASKYDRDFEMFRRKRAERAGNEAVTELHYDYDASGKPKIMTTPTGSVLTQFQTYSWNFFNYQRKIVKAGKNEVMSGMWNGEGAQRMYRLGMLYLAVGGIMSPLLNTDLTTLVQNDTLEKLQGWHKFGTGDAEDRQRAMFGRGLSSLAGPTISDAVRMGQVAGMFEMSEDDWRSYIFGYENFATQTKDAKVEAVVKTLQTGAGRFLYGHLPSTVSGGNFGNIITDELALYNSKANKQKQAIIQGSKWSPLKPLYDKYKAPTKTEKLRMYQRREGATLVKSNKEKEIMESLQSLE